MTTTGRILKFDQTRGFGFIESPDCDEDVFMHANDLLDEEDLFRGGTRVEFVLVPSDRGPKAAEVRLLPLPARTVTITPAPSKDEPTATSGQLDAPEVPDLTAEQVRSAVTEMLLAQISSLTAAQVVAVREVFVDYARQEGFFAEQH